MRRRWTVLLFGLLLLGSASLAGPFYPNLSPQILAFLGGHSSPIVDDSSSGPAFISAGVTYNVDPRLIAALTGPETSYGTHYGRCPATGFNAWSWLPKGSCKTFTSYGDAITYSASALSRIYLDVGLTTIPQIFKKYCTTGCASNWVSVVTAAYTKMGGDQTDLFYVTLDGNWAGTATLTDDQGTYTIPISASFNIMSDSITATVVFTNPGDIPTMNTITYEVNGPTDCSVNDNSSDHLSGFEVTTCNVSVPVGQGQAIISGNGAGEDPDPTDKASGNGTVTFSTAHIAPGQVGQASNAGDLIIVGTVTITGSDGTEKGSGTLQISSDQSHISGTAQTTDGTHVTWSVDND